ncbi:hypothetical protein [Oryza sativa Japonica Group]|uniref:Uncharacterized protein n=1 Tax=Oryza sativa subsp. japonica TaxID=39947 RepID=Q5JLY4_ORYSJ|nr:hypothetical protein [Oryza sativa Japonica Group]
MHACVPSADGRARPGFLPAGRGKAAHRRLVTLHVHQKPDPAVARVLSHAHTRTCFHVPGDVSHTVHHHPDSGSPTATVPTHRALELTANGECADRPASLATYSIMLPPSTARSLGYDASGFMHVTPPTAH